MKRHFILVVLYATYVVCDESATVTIDQGDVLGKLENTFLKEQKYFSFKGIPYAKPPIGSLRFKPPEPHEGWEGIYEATANKPTCFQYNSKMRNGEPVGMSGNEDCLYISVFTPQLDGSLPVIVFDYHDNFRTGFNGTKTYSPEFFMEESVIIVTIQHRLNIFGYFTTQDEVIPPNAGLKDFILGLHWVKHNINKFGGNPNQVTLMGNLGGGALVNILLYSEKVSGLFSGAIIESGSAMGTTFFDTNTREVAFKVGEVLDIKTNDSVVLLQELQKFDSETLTKTEGDAASYEAFEVYQLSRFPFAPIVEKDNPDAIIKSLPENSKIINDVPILIGMNSREGLDAVSHLIFEPKLLTDLAQDFLFVFPIRPGFRFNRKSDAYDNAIKEILNFYFEQGYLYYNNILEYAVYVGDILTNYALNSEAKKLATHLESPVYYYVFDFRGQLNENSEYMARYARSSMEHWGATVGDNLCYLHLCTRIKKKYEILKKLVSEPAEIKVLRKMVRLWANFAKTRNPTPTNDDVLKDFKWSPINKNTNNTNYLQITKTLKMKTDPLGEREIFWDEFLTKYAKNTVDGIVQNDEKLNEKLVEIEEQNHEEL